MAPQLQDTYFREWFVMLWFYWSLIAAGLALFFLTWSPTFAEYLVRSYDVKRRASHASVSSTGKHRLEGD